MLIIIQKLYFHMYNKSVNTSNHCDQEVESPVTYHYASDDFMNVGRQAD